MITQVLPDVFYKKSDYRQAMGIGDWGLGIGDWGLGPNPQSPIPNPQSPLSPEIYSKLMNII